jgi:hypothetical protein
MFQRLTDFRDAHGHCLVPKGWSEDPLLASWVERIRALGRQVSASSAGVNPPPREAEAAEPVVESDVHAIIDQLIGNLGNEEATSDDTASFAEKDAIGDAAGNSARMPVPVSRANDALHLSVERKERLNALGFVWDLREKRINDYWDYMFCKVRRLLSL